MIHSKIGAGSPREVVGFEFCSSVLRGVTLPVVLAKTCLRQNMANAAHFTPTGPTISSGCSGATYAAHLARQHQKAAPVPPAHTCGLRYERSTAGWCAEAAGAGAHSLCLYRGLTTMHASAQHSSGMPRPDRPVGLQVRPLETQNMSSCCCCDGIAFWQRLAFLDHEILTSPRPHFCCFCCHEHCVPTS